MLKKAIKKRGLVIVFSLVFFIFLFLSPYFLFAQERKGEESKLSSSPFAIAREGEEDKSSSSAECNEAGNEHGSATPLAIARVLEIEYPKIFGLKPETIGTGLPEYARYIFNLSIAIVGFVLFGALIRGGILYLTSAGNVVKLKEARDQISSAFLGTILLLSGYIILTTINPELVIFRFPPLEKPVVPEKPPVVYKPEEMTQIYWEIPVGQMLEEGLWEKKRTNNLKASLISFEESLNQELTKAPEPINKLSDLNRYLKTLTESCHCEELMGICQKAKNFAFPVGCFGDPCKEVRKEINNVLKTNEKKSKELSAYKEKFVEAKNTFEGEGGKFRNIMEVLERCQQRGLLTRAEYYDSLAFIEEQGGKTELIKSHLPAKDDPLVFYCAIGGTIFDYPYTPEEISPEELELAEEFLEPAVEEPLSCPIVIPLGELIMDQVSAISYETNSGLEELIYYIDKILAELTKMTELISQCNESRCNVSCACIPNPCFEPACGIPPARVNKCGIGKCTFPTPVTPNLCYFFCDSPCLQAVGGCHGEPCPRQEITETVERIKIYEDEIFKLLDWIKGDIEDVQLVLETKEEGQIDLNGMRADIQTCLSLGPSRTREKPKEEPFWVLLRCEMALGNKDASGNIITNCHPQNFFCCSTKPARQDIARFSSTAREERPPVYTPLPEELYKPTAYGFNKVPYFSQYDEKWRSKTFGCGTTIAAAGCGPTSMAMPLNFFGIGTDPPSVADWVLKNGYRVCGAGTAHAACCKAVEIFGKEEGLKCKELHGNVGAVLKELKNGENKVAVVSSRGTPPYSKGGHYIVLTGIEKEWGREYVYYNDPAYDPFRPQRRPAQGRKPIDWFESRGIGAGCVIYK